MRVVRFVHNAIFNYQICLEKNKTSSFKDGKKCSNREAIGHYLFAILDSGEFKHTYHVSINHKTENKNKMKRIISVKIQREMHDKDILDNGLELLKRLR